MTEYTTVWVPRERDALKKYLSEENSQYPVLALAVEIDCRKHFTDGKTHWYPAPGWSNVAEAGAAWPGEKFRAVDPPLQLTQELVDKMD